MPSIDIVKRTPITRSPRVMQIEGLFDMASADTCTEAWHVDVVLPNTWNIGVIVGPSGCGKSTIAQALFPEGVLPEFSWAENASLLDGFPQDLGIKRLGDYLSSVGFSSPPSWLKPFHVLSTGEKFRVTLARMLTARQPLTVIDEFSSVVDRQVAQICSAAFQKSVRRHQTQVVLVTCHYDVLPWLEPDWIYEPHLARYTPGRSLHRPSLTLTVARVHADFWRLFHKHHYLSQTLNSTARCFCGFLAGVPVAFQAWLHYPHPQPHVRMKRISRTVVLPDYQGVGISQHLCNYLASVVWALGYRAGITMSHPSSRATFHRSPVWRCIRQSSLHLRVSTKSTINHMSTASGRFTESFEYNGPAAEHEEAQQLWNSRPVPL